ncbi:Uma2 family endonuclease [Roseofilum sp. BLCC_M154]|uniref:Uma2 family endonuclease n=1 Tax=Roseofilum acuticapitatum BLCC-M154 TaxID=3022444 RepID=A0ABT7ALQ9_9CYAN|nr:Uma2 family endonuclease [Roseofilum acuticapitatum]MDJ1167820.1 Uma2 family endonuclease [Roseofilum acuticapitatum BLCC-M154]
MADPIMIATPLSSVHLRLITTADYHRMAEIGILGADEQVELIAGQIIQKMPKGPAHSALCKRIEKLLEHHLSDRALVRLQDPIQLNPYSEPEPDIAVVHPHPNFYADHHPTPDEVYLIVEIADTTIDRDLGTKANLYAVAGIPDYWVFNITSQQLHIFQDPQPNGYQRQLILLGQQSVSPLAFPDCTITVQECF